MFSKGLIKHLFSIVDMISEHVKCNCISDEEINVKYLTTDFFICCHRIGIDKYLWASLQTELKIFNVFLAFLVLVC